MNNQLKMLLLKAKITIFHILKTLKVVKINEKKDKILKLDIIELSILNEFIIIYNVLEHDGKVDKLNIAELISIKKFRNY